MRNGVRTTNCFIFLQRKVYYSRLTTSHYLLSRLKCPFFVRRFWRFWRFCILKELWRVERVCLIPSQLATRCSGYHWELLGVGFWLFFMATFGTPPRAMTRDCLLSELSFIRNASSLSKILYSSINHLHMVLGASFVSFESRIVVALVRKGKWSKLVCNSWTWLSLM